ncbi:hypothetical protein R3W88_027125 [Solanum pinnatisectum]|uniref:Uncharacterized protein n=1 Tax=Solanum pinnatisectum TaxID=50273 RepID=A0AAV9LF42_9SOLN|nr:hypothetical protein R3W88_027125 [Solanum pinnatisectum]
MDRTLRKSTRLNKSVVVVDSPPVICSRSSFELNEFTQSPINEGIRGDNKISKGSIECVVNNSSSTSKVHQKMNFIVNTNRKGKEKVIEASVEKNYPHDNNFEDEIPIAKRLRLNNDRQLSVKSKGSNLKRVSSLIKKRKKSTQPLKVIFKIFVYYLVLIILLSVLTDDELDVIEAENLIDFND